MIEPNPRPLVVRLGALGDMVVCTPALQALAEASGQPCDLVGAGAWSREIFKGLELVADIHVLGSRNRPYWLSREQRELVAALRQRGPGPCWVFGKPDKALELLRRAGYPREWIVTTRDCPSDESEHAARQWLDMTDRRPPGCTHWPTRPAGTDLDFRLAVSEPERDDARRWLAERGLRPRGYVLFQVGNKKTMRRWLRRGRADDSKYWPPEHWAALAEQVVAGNDLDVLLIGVPSEQGVIEAVLDAARSDRIRPAFRDVPLRRLVALLSLARACVSVDTGPAHVAAAVNCPLLVLFGATRPERNRPLSAASPVVVVSGQGPGGPNLGSLRPEQALDGWQRLIACAASAA